MQLRHVMIDLETLDTIATAKILSIGAVKFDPRLGKLDKKDTFHMVLDHKSQRGRTASQDTIDWWKSQSPEAKKSLHGTDKLEDALEELDFWLPDDCKVWGNGSIFNIAIMENAYLQYSMEIPWKFWNIYDMRTVKFMYESSRGGWEKKCGGTLHNAVDDAYYQAVNVCGMWKKMFNQMK